MRVLYATLAWILFVSPTYASTGTYTKKLQLGPIRLTYSDLDQFFGGIAKFVARANQQTGAQTKSETLTLSDGIATVELKNISDEPHPGGLPSIATSLSYSLEYAAAPISRLNITMSDSERLAFISGTSQADVELLSTLISEEARRYSPSFGGQANRGTAGTLLLLVGAIGVVGVLPLSKAGRIPIKWVVLPVIGMGLMIFGALFPTMTWFPGFILYAQQDSFEIRYGPQIGLWGLVVGIVSLAASIVFFAVQLRRRNSKASR